MLDATKWQEFPLKEKIIISPNTAMYVCRTYTLPDKFIDCCTVTALLYLIPKLCSVSP